jgi:ABC-2 type transport system permease protein
MPIHDQSYRRYRGERGRLGTAWSVITLAGIKTMIRRRAFVGLVLVAWMPFVIQAVQVYLAANFPQASILAPTPEKFRELLDNPFLLFVTIYAGAGLIANDRRANALQIYLSKPLTRVEYVAGKLGVLVAFQLLVTIVPTLLLLLLQVLFTGSFAFVRTNAFLIPAIVLFGTIQIALASFTMLALSSLSRSSRYVGILYAGAILFSEAMFQTLTAITGGTRAAWISLMGNLRQLGDALFRLSPRYDTPWAVSLVVVIGLIVVSVSILERRVRGVEVVT